MLSIIFCCGDCGGKRLGFFRSSNGLNHSKDTFEPNWIVFLPCCSLHSHKVSKQVSVTAGKIGKPSISAQTPGAHRGCCGTAATATVCNPGLALAEGVKCGEEKQMLHFPFHSTLRSIWLWVWMPEREDETEESTFKKNHNRFSWVAGDTQQRSLRSGQCLCYHTNSAVTRGP